VRWTIKSWAGKVASSTTQLALTAKTFVGNLRKLTQPYWVSDERWTARGLLVAIIALNLGQVYLLVLFNQWYQVFFNALQDKNFAEFKWQLLRFAGLATIYILMAIYQLYLNMLLQIRWRRWLTEVYCNDWLADGVYYRMEVKDYGTDNPDQRIAQDLQLFTSTSLSLGLGLLKALVTLASFVDILWGLSGSLPVSVTGVTLVIPGYMVWAALLYAAAGTWLTHKIGHPLVGLNFDQQRFEADFRFSLVRLRENAEGVALYHGEADEKRHLLARFGMVWQNWWGLMKYRKRLLGFTAGFDQIATIFPFLVAAPRYFSGAIQLGGLMQISFAFGQVRESLSWFVTAYANLAEWKATVDRLTSFHQAMQTARGEAQSRQGITVDSGEGKRFVTRDLTLALPDGRVLVAGANAAIAAGEHALLTGPSGSGKSTLFRALAGIWPFGRGQIEMPPNARVLFLPQRPYVPIGTFRDVVSFPSSAGTFDDVRIVEALRACYLDTFMTSLDDVQHWAQRLSPGEQQRLGFARALLQKPDWLFLDEATTALDEVMEQHLYKLIRSRLPNTTYISIAHRLTLAAFHVQRLTLVPDGARMQLVAKEA
jgi:vitamin B12/bleomycin/antimicrobial peptide transport system ATP-binding/permease protein